MSLKLNERYPGRFSNPTPEYPQGAFKNRSTPTAKDGSYLEKDWANDKEGFFQSLLSGAGIVPNGNVDAVGASQAYTALIKLIDDRANAAFDPWAAHPIGVPFPIMFDAAAPPKDKAYRYILLTYGDPYNAGVLTEEVITGVAPLVTSYARISLPGSPITGNTVYLLNTERRSIRPGGAGSNQDDALQNITGSVRGGIPTYQLGTPDGSFSCSPTPGSSQTGITGGGNNGMWDLTFDASRIARTSFETRVKNAGANFFMRVK